MENLPPQDINEKPERGRFGSIASQTKRAALIGALAFGLGTAEEAQARDSGHSKKVTSSHSVHIEESVDKNIIDTIYEDVDYLWQVELVPKHHEDGTFYLAEVYTKVDKSKNESIHIGEFDNLNTAAIQLSHMENIPEQVRLFNSSILEAIEKEKEFRQTGLTKEDIPVNEILRENNKKFKGYGVDVTIKYDENGEAQSVDNNEEEVKKVDETKNAAEADSKI